MLNITGLSILMDTLARGFSDLKMPVVQWSLMGECNYINIPFLLTETAVPPWVDSNEEETIQQQILALSAVCGRFLLFIFSARNGGKPVFQQS